MPTGLIFALIAVVAFGGWTAYERMDAAKSAVAKAEAQQRAAEAQVQAKADELKQTAANSLIDMEAAFDAGRAQGQQQARVVYAKGAQYAETDKGLSNPACVMGPDGLRFLNAARADLRTAALAANGAVGLPGPGAAGGPVVRSAVPAVDPGRGAVPGVPQQPPAIRPAGQVPGLGVPAHPKPTPVAGK